MTIINMKHLLDTYSLNVAISMSYSNINDNDECYNFTILNILIIVDVVSPTTAASGHQRILR